MFEEFSSGYYLGRLYVEPHDGEQALMQSDQHERVEEQLYDDFGGPLVMKIGSTHLPVHGGDGVPGQTVALPEAALPPAGVDNPPALREVLLAKADRAAQLMGLGGEGRPPPGSETDAPADVDPGDGPAGF